MLSAPAEGPAVGATVRVRVPATSANLGPGFDALGLALARQDEVSLTIVDVAAADPSRPMVDVDVVVTGEGSEDVPRDVTHLVVRAAVAALRASGVEQRLRLQLTAHNQVPHGRGLGSSAAAAVAGTLAGLALASPSTLPSGPVHAAPGAPDGPAPADVALALATSFEGHPDNAAPAILGGATVAWMPVRSGHPLGPNADASRPQAAQLRLHPDLVAVVAIPVTRLATERARGLLPAAVPHSDAAFAAGRAALLVHALAEAPDLLLPATADTLHQEARRAAMPSSLALVDALRADGSAAVVSGAGPTVLVLTTASQAEAVAARTRELVAHQGAGVGAGWGVEILPVDRAGAQVVWGDPAR
ncbi:MAG: homoserine kinase [Actinomycetales bacterium]